MASYKVYIENEAKAEIRSLPGHVRQRVSRAIRELVDDPTPHASRPLQVPGIAVDVRRIRIDRWRVIYTIDPEWEEIIVYAVRKRPPYNYHDLDAPIKRT